MLTTDNLSYKVNGNTILNAINIEVNKGSFTSILGPNGAGKSSLIHLLTGGNQSFKGNVHWHKKPIQKFSVIELARQRAVLSQHNTIQFPIEVRDVIQLGRQPYIGTETPKMTKEAIDFGIETWCLQNFLDRNYQSLSGGEKQQVQFARIWTQLYAKSYSGKILFIDEPLTYLDIHNQLLFMKKVEKIHQNGLTIVAVFHQLDMALKYSDQIILLHRGEIEYSGPPEESKISPLFQSVFNIETHVSNFQSEQFYNFRLPY